MKTISQISPSGWKKIAIVLKLNAQHEFIQIFCLT